MVSNVVKRLTRNDLGLTGGHQAGICVPFKIVKLGFFPELDSSIKNPRVDIPFNFAGQTIVFSYVYYNGRVIGDGTRNEYRLTGMTKFFKDNNCAVDDLLEFSLNEGRYSIDIKHQSKENYDDPFDLNEPLIIRADWIYR